MWDFVNWKLLWDIGIVFLVLLGAARILDAKWIKSSVVKWLVALAIVVIGGVIIATAVHHINLNPFKDTARPVGNESGGGSEFYRHLGIKLLLSFGLLGLLFFVGPVKYLISKTKPTLIAAISLVLVAIALVLLVFGKWPFVALLVVGYFLGCGYSVPLRMRGTPTFHGSYGDIAWDVGLHFWRVPTWYVGSGMILVPYESVNQNVATDWLQTKATKEDPKTKTPHGAGAAIKVKYVLYIKTAAYLKPVIGFSNHTPEALFQRVKELVDAWLDTVLKGQDYDWALNNITKQKIDDEVVAEILMLTGCLITKFEVNDRDPDPLLAEIYSKTEAMNAEERQLEQAKVLARLRGEADGEEEVARLRVIDGYLQNGQNMAALNALRDLTLVRKSGTVVIASELANLSSLAKLVAGGTNKAA